MNNNYNFIDFVRTHIDKDLDLLKGIVDKEAGRLNHIQSTSPKGIKAIRDAGGFKFLNKLRKLAYFLKTAKKPAFLDESDLAICRELAEKLVECQQWKRSVLDEWITK